jgi:hypothetical protein
MTNVVPNPPKTRRVNGWVIATIILIIVVAVLLALSVWLYSNYTDQKTNVDTKINMAVSAAEKSQADSDNLKFTQREKDPNRQFVGPSDYGGVTFDYPKTWSVYISNDASNGGNFDAYMNPITVPEISDSQLFALRVDIAQQDYDQVISSYESTVKSGELTASSVTTDGNTGTRLDGYFSTDVRGSAVFYKIPHTNLTLTIRTDAMTFESDFNSLITTIKFNQ